jgi:hypothetical protein
MKHTTLSLKEFFVSGTFGALGTRFGAFGTLKKKINRPTPTLEL